MLIRTLTEEDIPQVIDVAGKCEHLIVERSSIFWIFWRFFRNTSFVAVENKTIVGILLGFMDQVDNTTGFIHLLGVLETHRNQGVATQLIVAFAKAVKERNGNKLSLTTYTTNERAMQFYEHRGFTERREIEKVGEKRIEFIKHLV